MTKLTPAAQVLNSRWNLSVWCLLSECHSWCWLKEWGGCRRAHWAILKWCCLYFVHCTTRSSSWQEPGQHRKEPGGGEQFWFGLLPVYLLAYSTRAGLTWMDKLLDNRVLKFPLHYFGIKSRRACLTVALMCVMKYNRQSPKILQQIGFTFCSMFYRSYETEMW